MPLNTNSNFEVRKALGNEIKFNKAFDMEKICEILGIDDQMSAEEKKSKLESAMQDELKLTALKRLLREAFERMNSAEETALIVRGIIDKLIRQHNTDIQTFPNRQIRANKMQFREPSWIDKLESGIESKIFGPIIERLLLKHFTGSFKKPKRPEKE